MPYLKSIDDDNFVAETWTITKRVKQKRTNAVKITRQARQQRKKKEAQSEKGGKKEEEESKRKSITFTS